MSVSVVIPTYNRADLLARQLQCLARQRGVSEMEVIVCDDGSSDHTAEVVAAATDRLNVIRLFQKDLGYRCGEARNMGFEAARGDVVVTIDDDCLMTPDFIAAHVAAHRNRVVSGVALGYRYRAAHLDRAPDTLAEIRAYKPEDRLRRYGVDGRGLARERLPWRAIYTCNMSLPRAATAQRIDPSFRGWGMEDMEFGLRLTKAGFKPFFVPDALVLHLDDASPSDPFLARAQGKKPDFSTFIPNLLRLFHLHHDDPDVTKFVWDQLRWFRYEGNGGWSHSFPPLTPAGRTDRERAMTQLAHAAGVPFNEPHFERLFKRMRGPRMPRIRFFSRTRA